MLPWIPALMLAAWTPESPKPGGWTTAPDRLGLPSHLPAWGLLLYDMDGDAVIELGLVTHGGKPRYFELQDGRFVEAHDDPWAGQAADRHGAVPCDLDGDGDVDLVQTVGGRKGEGGDPAQIYWRDADGWRAEGLPSTQGMRMRGVSCLDVNADGLPELHIASHGGKADQVLVQQDGGWVDVAPAWGLARKGKSYGVQAGDLDGDGDMDLVRLEDNRVALLLQGDDGVFAPGPWQPDTQAVRDVELFDVDNDGDLDLYLARARYYEDSASDHGGLWHVSPSDSDGGVWRVPANCGRVRVAAQGTLDGGSAELIGSVTTDKRVVIKMDKPWTEPAGDGLRVWVDGDLLHVQSRGQKGRVRIALECMDGGQPTLVEHSVEPKRVLDSMDQLLLNEGDRFVLSGLPTHVGVPSVDAVPVDVDLDGDLDVFVVTEALAQTSENAPDVLLENRNGTLVLADSFPVLGAQAPLQGRAGVAQDLNGDGYPELVVANGEYHGPLAGDVVVWMNPGGDMGAIQVHVAERDGRTSQRARIEVIRAEGTLWRGSNPWPDFRSHGMARTWIGIGHSDQVEVRVHWPDGKVQRVKRVHAGQTVTVRRRGRG